MMIDNGTQEVWIRGVLERYEAPLLRYAYRLSGNAETARDVVQDTFLRLCTARREEIEERIAAWLYTVCRNRAFDVNEKDARMKPMDEATETCSADDAPHPGVVIERQERHALVLAELTRLPENQQEAFRLKFQQDLTYREISEVMGVSLGTVSGLITSALMSLRERLHNGAEQTQGETEHA